MDGKQKGYRERMEDLYWATHIDEYVKQENKYERIFFMVCLFSLTLAILFLV
jgi:hypothetical protein